MSAISRESQIRTARQEFLDRNGSVGGATSTQPFDLLLANLATPAAESAKSDAANRRDRTALAASGSKSEASRGKAKSPSSESRQTQGASGTPRSTPRETPAANHGGRENASAPKDSQGVTKQEVAPVKRDGVPKADAETDDSSDDLWLDPSQVRAYAHALPSLSLPTEVPAVEAVLAEPLTSAIDSSLPVELPSPDVDLELANEFEWVNTLDASMPLSAEVALPLDSEIDLVSSVSVGEVHEAEFDAIDQVESELPADALTQEDRQQEISVAIEPTSIALSLDFRAKLEIKPQSQTAPLEPEEQPAEIATVSMEQKPNAPAPVLSNISKGEEPTESNSTVGKSKASRRSESVVDALPSALPLVESHEAVGVELGSSETQSPAQELPSVQGYAVSSTDVDGARDASRSTNLPTLTFNASTASLNSQVELRDSSRMEHADGTRRAVGLTAAEYRRFQHRVEKAFELASQRDGEIRLRLSPPRLGSLRVELKLEGETMTARVETETEGARQLIMDSLPALRDRLAEQGIRIQSFEVDLYTDQRSAQEQSFDQSQQRDRQRPSTHDESNDERIPSLAERRMLGGSGLDVMI